VISASRSFAYGLLQRYADVSVHAELSGPVAIDALLRSGAQSTALTCRADDDRRLQICAGVQVLTILEGEGVSAQEQRERLHHGGSGDIGGRLKSAEHHQEFCNLGAVTQIAAQQRPRCHARRQLSISFTVVRVDEKPGLSHPE
jgi:hypothetical protein